MSLDPLWQITSWMPKEPQFWEAEKTREDNILYQNETIDLSKSKEDLNRDLWYWEFDPSNISANKEKIQKEEQDILNKENPENILSQLDKKPEEEKVLEDSKKEILDSPLYPQVKELLDSWYIDTEKFNKFIETISDSTKEEAQKEAIDLVNSLSNLDEKTKNEILDNISWETEEITEENFESSKYAQDIKWVEIKTSKNPWWLDLMLASNYISIPNENWWNDIEKNINSTFNKTTNVLLLNNSKDFKKQHSELVENIRKETSLERKYILLNDLYKQSLLEDAKVWWKKWKEEIKKQQENFKQQAEENTRLITEARKNNNQEEIKRLEIEKQNIIKEAKGLDWFENLLSSLAPKDSSIDWVKEKKEV